MRTISWMRKHSRAIQIVGGIAMILVGLALLTGLWESFINAIRQWTVSWSESNGTTLI